MSRPRTFTAATLSAATITAGLALAAPAATASSAAPAVKTVAAADPEDVGNRLDILWERFTLNDNGTITLTIRTAETWKCGYLQNFAENGEPYSAGLLWNFDRGANGSFGDSADRTGAFDCNAGRLQFHLPTTSGAKTFPASRPTASSVTVTFPRPALEAQHLNAQAISRFSGTQGNHIALDEEDLTPTLKAY